MDSETIVGMAQRYAARYPGEAATARRFARLALAAGPEGPLSRRNFAGHLTASAFVLSKDGSRVLLVRHRTLGRLLQPGGHIEPGDASLLAAAMREVEEETGLGAGQLELPARFGAEPVDIDIHVIPPNAARGEAAHFHYDVRFLLRCTAEEPLLRCERSELLGLQWVPLARFAYMEDFARPAAKIAAWLKEG